VAAFERGLVFISEYDEPRRTPVHCVFRRSFRIEDRVDPAGRSDKHDPRIAALRSQVFKLRLYASGAAVGACGVSGGPRTGNSSGVRPGNSSGRGGSPGSCSGGGTSGCGFPGGLSCGGSAGCPGWIGGSSSGSIGIYIATLRLSPIFGREPVTAAAAIFT
jgi:hypothetical protein